MRTRDLIESVENSIYERLATHSRSFDYELMKLQDATCERHAIFEMLVTDSKDSTELKIKEFSELFSKEVYRIDKFCDVVT